MSDDYARATGAAGTIWIGDREYRVSKFTPRDIGDLQAWLKEQVPDPRLEARRIMEGMPDAVAIEVWKTMALEAKEWPPTLATEKGNELLTVTSEGIARLLWVTLRKHNGVDLGEARKLSNDISIEDLGHIMQLASPESDQSPKAVTTPTDQAVPKQPTNNSGHRSLSTSAGRSTRSIT